MPENFNYGDISVAPHQFTSSEQPSAQEQAWNALGSAAIFAVSQRLPEGMANAKDLLEDPAIAPAPRRSGKEVTDEAIAAVLDIDDAQDPAKLGALRKALSEYKAAEKAAQTDEQSARLLGYSRNKGFQVSQNEDGSFSVVIGTGDRGTTNYLITVPKEGKISVASKVNGAFVPGYNEGEKLSEAQKALKISAKGEK